MIILEVSFIKSKIDYLLIDKRRALYIYLKKTMNIIY